MRERKRERERERTLKRVREIEIQLLIGRHGAGRHLPAAAALTAAVVAVATVRWLHTNSSGGAAMIER